MKSVFKDITDNILMKKMAIIESYYKVYGLSGPEVLKLFSKENGRCRVIYF